MLTTGNAAKLYCLDWIDSCLQSSGGEGSILDLGCGTASNFIKLLNKYPKLEYVGIEPMVEAVQKAAQNLQGLNGTVIHAPAYNTYQRLARKFSFVISFSALEHVYKRYEYLQSARQCLTENGYFLINYDSGHFVQGQFRDHIKNIVGPLAARFGYEKWFQRFVPDAEFYGIIEKLGLHIIESKFFNTHLKGVYKVVPEAHRSAYMQRWLEMELALNEMGIKYTDGLARSFHTRNFILTLKA